MSESLDRYYRVLGLSEGASKREIKGAYRRLALRYHPDKNPHSQERAARIFTAVNKAYSILIDNAHIGESFEDVDDAKIFFRRHFHDLTRRIDSTDYVYDEIHQEECDFFFRYQLEHVRCVRRSTIEARRIICLIRKAMSKGYDTSEILKDHIDFFQKHGFEEPPEYDIDEELIVEYRSLIEEEPCNAEAHYSLACIYRRLGLIDAAISEYQIASYIEPDNAEAKQAAELLRRKRREFS